MPDSFVVNHLYLCLRSADQPTPVRCAAARALARWQCLHAPTIRDVARDAVLGRGRAHLLSVFDVRAGGGGDGEVVVAVV
jgi:hypothetical protein